jgi:hypothetical protein
MYRRTLSIAALLAVPAIIGAAGDSELDRATMRGLKAVNVVIDRIDPQLPKEGVRPADLQARIESKLKDAGIALNPEANEFVGLQITAVRDKRGPYALSFTVGLYQPVLLSRDRNARTVTKTWEVETILMADPKVLQKASIESVDDLAARFVAAWRTVNPSAPKP